MNYKLRILNLKVYLYSSNFFSLPYQTILTSDKGMIITIHLYSVFFILIINNLIYQVKFIRSTVCLIRYTIEEGQGRVSPFKQVCHLAHFIKQSL